MGAAAGESTSVAKDAGVISPAKSVTLNGVRVSEREEKGNTNNISSKQWNTHNLGKRLTVDLASAAAAGGLVAPIISVIDK